MTKHKNKTKPESAVEVGGWGENKKIWEAFKKKKKKEKKKGVKWEIN